MPDDDDNTSGTTGRREPKIKDASALPKHLGAKLRSLFADAEAQPVPDRLLELLDELAAKEAEAEKEKKPE